MNFFHLIRWVKSLTFNDSLLIGLLSAVLHMQNLTILNSVFVRVCLYIHGCEQVRFIIYVLFNLPACYPFNLFSLQKYHNFFHGEVCNTC